MINNYSYWPARYTSSKLLPINGSLHAGLSLSYVAIYFQRVASSFKIGTDVRISMQLHLDSAGINST